jgi:hypothetical protein
VKNPILVGACLLTLLPAGVSAQAIDGEVQPRFIFGPLGLTPRVALKDLGVDSNPGNVASGGDQDVTFTLAPGVDSVLRIGRGRLTGKTSLEYVYFNESDQLRSFNINQEAKAELQLNRLAPFATGSYIKTRQRPNLEIDERVQQYVRAVGAGFALKVGARTNLEFEGRQSRLEYGNGQYGSAEIAAALDRDTNTFSLTSKTALTSQTTFVLRGERLTDRFANQPVRDSDSVTVLPGFEFKPTALVSGKVSVGFRQFDALDSSVPDFTGVVGELDARYTWREQTRFNFRAIRNIEYSIEETQPYFVSNGGGLEVTQSIGLNWYAAARANRTRLVYRDFVSATGTASGVGRSDRVDLYGVGFGRRLRDDLRIGLDVNQVRKISTIPEREYDGYRVGVSITYGS